MDDRSPRRHAAALAYNSEDARRSRAPKVTASGQGLVADEIIERARAAGVPIHASRELSALLTQVDLDQHIPPALYVAVAEVLAWVYRLEGRAAPRPQRN
ncbi:MAG TPA: EscU/YscU/HrcU family type III secretion system export apparatus switch protein [Burkholderiaceae bacterium]|nr:EscU/YscU/HrcU family type III secretion system export apparatus switch protein [Burkholderiaceae bacterium]